MAENPFETVLKEELAASKGFQDSLAVLQQFCQGIELTTGQTVQCSLERGSVLSYGQEWRPVLRSSDGGRPQVLFRAYVPLEGWPVTLDLHEEALSQCKDEEELTQALQEFLRDPNVIAQIRYFMFHPSPVPAAS